MTAGSLVAVPGMLTVAAAPSLVVFYAGWVLVGAAMAGTLYPPAFAALTRWGGERRVRALTTVTLAGGLASTVFAPLAALLDDVAGAGARRTSSCWAWPPSCTVPLHWRGLRRPWRSRAPTAAADPATDEAGRAGSG